MDNIYVYIVDLPPAVSEMVAPCSGGYTVYLNAKLSYQDRVNAYIHALEHVERNDWENADVQQIEKETHESPHC